MFQQNTFLSKNIRLLSIVRTYFQNLNTNKKERSIFDRLSLSRDHFLNASGHGIDEFLTVFSGFISYVQTSKIFFFSSAIDVERRSTTFLFKIANSFLSGSDRGCNQALNEATQISHLSKIPTLL